MIRRFGLFALVNIGVIITISVMTSLLGLNSYLTANGINYQSLAIFCLIWGFTGSFISLLISKKMAMFSMQVKIIDSSTPSYGWIHQRVDSLAQKAGIKTPDVGIYEGEANAFATGAFKNSALVAVSTGLLKDMTQKEVEAVLAHEVAHIANGDMVTSTLLQGVINSFVMFFSRVLAYAIAVAMKDEDGKISGVVQMVATIVLDIVFSIVGSLVVKYHSRTREYSADQYAADLMGNPQPMIAALKALKRDAPAPLPEQMAAMGISGDFKNLFSTHPTLDSRIEALQNYSPRLA